MRIPKIPKKPKRKHADEGQGDRAAKTPHSAPNPPTTTTGPFTAPKFGSAGSGGLENEPGPERD